MRWENHHAPINELNLDKDSRLEINKESSLPFLGWNSTMLDKKKKNQEKEIAHFFKLEFNVNWIDRKLFSRQEKNYVVIINEKEELVYGILHGCVKVLEKIWWFD